MGGLRLEKEKEEQDLGQPGHAEFESKRAALELAEAETRARISALQQELDKQLAELKTLATVNDASLVSSGKHKSELRRLRSADRATVAPRSRAGNGAGKPGR